ncbi:NAD(P)-binding protein [Corynespora cassiicola Philippines]|uniref:Peroxisomal trans-2-enoyl-CoA reductase n=1 Tax=Corynespora cassiicola Philippines TaxID=1448308 RepID=A0A2T2NCZ0_CORCC|nr:NAD(P)-binding protein [Corynespora cassiicola Philippines]
MAGSTASAEGFDSEHFSPYRADGKLYGFVCVVTGASQPVGQAIVSELAAHGAACIYASPSLPPSLLTTLTTTHPNTKIIPYPYNPTSEESTLALIDDVLNTWGRLDIWTSSTGLLGPPSITTTSPHDLSAAFEANSMPAFFALKYAPAAMQKTTPKGSYPNAAPKDAPYGSIIVVSSVAGTYGGCWGPAFTMSSHAALGVVRSGVAVLKGTGVRINAITAGQIDVGVDLKGSGVKEMERGQFPPSSLQEEETQRRVIGLERAGRPEEVARVAGFLASGFSSYITGAELRVDGGASVMNPLTVPV